VKVISSIFEGSASSPLDVSHLCMRVKCHKVVLVASEVVAKVA
jgi:hypothetical protein